MILPSTWPFINPFMGFGRFGQGISRRDRNLEPGRIHRKVERLELAHAGHRVIRLHADARPRRRHRFHAVRPRGPSARAKCVQTPFETLPAHQGENGVDSIGSECARGGQDIAAASVHRGSGAQSPNQHLPVVTGCRCQNPRSAKLGKLDGEGSHAARAAVNDHRFVLADLEGVVDSLQRRQSGGRDRARLLQAEPLRESARLCPHPPPRTPHRIRPSGWQSCTHRPRPQP